MYGDDSDDNNRGVSRDINAQDASLGTLGVNLSGTNHETDGTIW